MMGRFFSRPALAAALVFLLPYFPLRAVDLSNGLITALPVKGERAPEIDGDLGDWDLSAQEPVYISEQVARTMNAEWAFMYDEDALYVSVRAALPERPYHNPNNPQDAFWSNSDILQFRIGSDPTLPYPLNRDRDSGSDRVTHVAFWKNSETEEDFIHLNRGVKLNRGQVVNPEGAKLVIKTEGEKFYTAEARIPWSALKVPDGKNPFKAGDKAPIVVETLWVGGDKSRVAAGYSENPGTFAFNSPHKWGQLEFAAQSLGERRRPTMEQLLAGMSPARKSTVPAIGVPIEIEVPEEGMKMSVNIFGPKGEVLRELVGGEVFPKGKATIKWDGRDGWGHPLTLGTYHWGAYLHKGLKAEYAGSVGTSGIPAYQTLDGKGGWGGDHSQPIACAADESGVYFLWPVAEAGEAVVKLDYDGKLLWRKNPFVGGGFGPFFAMASDGKYLYLARGNDEVFFVRIDAQTGALLTWGDGKRSELSVYKGLPVMVPQDATAVEVHDKKYPSSADGAMVPQPNALGMAVHDGKAYLSNYEAGKIVVIDTATGKVIREMACPGPRGLAVDKAGNLFAASFVPGKAAGVVRLAKDSEKAETVIARDLEAPFGVAVDAAGNLYVSDLGQSHQVKIFDAGGKFQKALGKKGGRPWQGAYDPTGFLNPAGIAIDAKGALVVAEASPPKVVSRWEVPGGNTLHRWYGPGVYWNSTWPMPDDPTHVFYMLNHAFGRGRVAGVDQIGIPDAYWNPDRDGYPVAGNVERSLPQPETVRADNQKLYLVLDAGLHTIFLLENEVLRPVAQWNTVTKREEGSDLKPPYIRVWMDRNADGLVQENEKSVLQTLAGGEALPPLANATSSMHMESNGDLYFCTQGNSILKIPVKAFAGDGSIQWDASRASLVVPEVLPGLKRLNTSHREGLLGVRLDKQKNLYTLFNARKGAGGAFDYVSEDASDRMREGMGHTSRFTMIKFAKFDPAGNLLWMAGRKATAGAQPGEMYHFWNMAGLVNDRYVAGASEWGQIYFYTHDGYFVDALMNNPGEVTAPGPYTFGGETSGGRVQYFPSTGEVWAYSTGMAYRVKGFSQGVVDGEKRLTGMVKLDKVYDLPVAQDQAPAGPLKLFAFPQDPMESAKAWSDIPVSVLKRNGNELAQVRLGYDANFLYGRIEVRDESPMQNEAGEVQLAFKGGDSAALVIGPAGDSAKPGKGDVRLMVAQVGGTPRLIGMKAVTGGAKQPFDYFTPSAGKVNFEYVGEVPGGRVTLKEIKGGYLAMFAVPRTFLEFDLKPGDKLRGDIEIRLSGVGGRGLQATSRNYLFTPSRSETSMTDDIPTESRLYPAYWGEVEVLRP